MADNKQIKDGLGNLFTIRMRDVSSGADGTVQRSLIYSTLYPVDYGNGGVFHRATKSDPMAANLAAASPVFSFHWPAIGYVALIRRVRLSAWSNDVGFVAGLASFDTVVARSFTAQLTGGRQMNLAGNNAKMKTAMSSSQADVMVSSGTAMTGGTYTLDGGPGSLDTWCTAVTANVYTPITMQPVTLFQKLQGETPLILAQNEGFIVKATVPQQGTWAFAIITEWDEVPATIGF